MTRIQKGALARPTEYERLKDSYVLTREMVERVKPDIFPSCILCRAVNEITADVDALSTAAYFRQEERGVCPHGARRVGAGPQLVSRPRDT